jgi:hypothetical protein
MDFDKFVQKFKKKKFHEKYNKFELKFTEKIYNILLDKIPKDIIGDKKWWKPKSHEDCLIVDDNHIHGIILHLFLYNEKFKDIPFGECMRVDFKFNFIKKINFDDDIDMNDIEFTSYIKEVKDYPVSYEFNAKKQKKFKHIYLDVSLENIETQHTRETIETYFHHEDGYEIKKISENKIFDVINKKKSLKKMVKFLIKNQICSSNSNSTNCYLYSYTLNKDKSIKYMIVPMHQHTFFELGGNLDDE